MASNIDESKKYNDQANGYRGVYSKYESLAPARFSDLKASNRPTQKSDIFSAEDLENYNMASIRVLPIVDEYSPNDSFLSRKGSYKSNADSQVTSEYIGFILIQAQEEKTEKHETLPLSGDSFASFFYGSNPSVYSYTGIALNTVQDRWRDSLEILYNNYIRGSSAIKNKTAVQLKYDNRIVTGFISSLSQSMSADSQSYSTFQLQIVVTDVTYLSNLAQDPTKLLNAYSRELTIKDALKESGLANKLLSSSRLNSLRDYTRTGFIVPPAAPPKQKGKSGQSTLSNCVLKPPIKDSQLESDTKRKTIDTSFAQTDCTGVDYRVALNSNVETLKTKLDETVSKLKTTTSLAEKEKLLAEAESLNNDLTSATEQVKEFQDRDSELSKAIAKQTLDELKDASVQATQGLNTKSTIKITYGNAAGKNTEYVVTNQEANSLANSSNEAGALTTASQINEQAAKLALGDKYINDEKAKEIEQSALDSIDSARKELNTARDADTKKRKAKTKKIDLGP